MRSLHRLKAISSSSFAHALYHISHDELIYPQSIHKPPPLKSRTEPRQPAQKTNDDAV